MGGVHSTPPPPLLCFCLMQTNIKATHTFPIFCCGWPYEEKYPKTLFYQLVCFLFLVGKIARGGEGQKITNRYVLYMFSLI